MRFSQFTLRSFSMNALIFTLLLLEFVDAQAQAQQHHDDYDNGSFLEFMGSSISSNNINAILTSTNDMIRGLGESDHTEHTTHSSSSSSSSSKPWGYVIGYTLLVNLVTFSGVILIALPSIRKDIKRKKMVKESMRLSALSNNNSDDNDGGVVPCYEAQVQAQQDSKLLNLIIPSFATGALLSTVLFLILPEAIMSLNNAHNEYVAEHEEHEQGNTRLLGHVGDIHEGEIDVSTVWKFGTAVLAGYLLPVLFEIFTHPKIGSSSSGLSPPSTAPCACDNDIDDVKEEKDEEEEVIMEENAASDRNLSVYYNANKKKEKDSSLVASIILGDFCHNFCDGVFIGVSFLFCSKSLAYTVVGVTIYHEVAQEMADFMLLTNILGLLDVKKALILNYLSGVSVIFGGILVLAVDISQMWIGLLLAISSGIYLFIACSECFPRAKSNMKTTKDIGVAIGAFLGGATPIGLTLMNHTHCEIHD